MNKIKDRKIKITAQDLTKIIQQGLHGEYGADHDWSPDGSLKTKIGWLEEMLKNWDQTEPEGKKLIMYFLRSLIKEAKENSTVVTDRLTPYAKIPEVAKVIKNIYDTE
ncbi:MAG: hypothetical protein V1664_01650 [Candidatus Uhrbacteria bacterium]